LESATDDTPEPEWRLIEGYVGYAISNAGAVVNLGSGRNMKISQVRHGLKKVGLSFRGRSKTLYIHRLVAQAFLEDYDEKREVLHKDEDKSNNHISNLEMGSGKSVLGSRTW
jgi:hypothetical protein